VGVASTGVRRDELAADVQVVGGFILDSEEAVEGEGEVERES
jgi:hypothetical protein